MTLFDVPAHRVMDIPLGEYAGRARHDDPATSVEAAKRITGRTERLILGVMGDSTWTADELCRALPTVYPPTLKTALSRLHNHKLIELTGQDRDSDRGSPMRVYRISR